MAFYVLSYDDAVALYKMRIAQPPINLKHLDLGFFPTPEFVAWKMIELAKIKSTDILLEPSAGTGNIARFFPTENKATLIEPSKKLSSQIPPCENHTIINTLFEGFSILNKFDVIIMNPPFGKKSDKALSHFKKAMMHLKPDGRLILLAPASGTMRAIVSGCLSNPDFALRATICFDEYLFKDVKATIGTNLYVIGKKVMGGRREIQTQATNCDELINELRGIEL